MVSSEIHHSAGGLGRTGHGGPSPAMTHPTRVRPRSCVRISVTVKPLFSSTAGTYAAIGGAVLPGGCSWKR